MPLSAPGKLITNFMKVNHLGLSFSSCFADIHLMYVLIIDIAKNWGYKNSVKSWCVFSVIIWSFSDDTPREYSFYTNWIPNYTDWALLQTRYCIKLFIYYWLDSLNSYSMTKSNKNISLGFIFKDEPLRSSRIL